MGTDAMILVFLNVSSQLFHSPLLPLSVSSSAPLCFQLLEWYYLHIRGDWYLSQQSWFQLVILPVWHFSWCTLHRSKQGDSIQPWHTPFPILNQSLVLCMILTVASLPTYRFLRSFHWSRANCHRGVYHCEPLVADIHGSWAQQNIGAHPLTFFSFTFFLKDLLPLLRTTLHLPYHIQVHNFLSPQGEGDCPFVWITMNYYFPIGNWKIKDGNITVPKDQCNELFLETMQSKLWWKSSLGPSFTCEQQCIRDCLFYILPYIKCTVYIQYYM